MTKIDFGKRKILKMILSVMLILTLLIPAAAFATGSSTDATSTANSVSNASDSSDASDAHGNKIVRVGWYVEELFQEGSTDTDPKSGYSYDYLRKVSNYVSWKFEYVYGEKEDLYEMLCDGEIDLMAGISDTKENRAQVLFPDHPMEPGQDETYLAVSKERPDLLDELNEAVEDMFEINPYILQELQYNNYGIAYAAKNITDGEKAWLEEHPVIRVGYMANYLPYSATDEDGNATGVVTDIINAIFESLDIDTIPEIEYVPFNGYQAIVDALNAGQIDAGFPVDSNEWRLEQGSISASSEVITDRGALFYKSTSTEEPQTIAVNENNVLQDDYSRRAYPDAEILYYPTIKECLDAVVAGEADGTIMDTLRVQYVTSQNEYASLSFVQLGQGTGKCFGVEQGNKYLLMLINRGLNVLGSTYGYNASFKYVNEFYTYTTEDFIKDHMLGISISSGCVLVLIIAMLALHIKRQMKALAVEEELKRQAERANAAKSMFLFNMSHDIRTPMNAVLGFIGLMRSNLDDRAKLSEYIDKAENSGHYLLSLINNVLEVARIDSGKDVVDENFTNIAEDTYYYIFENDAKNKNLNISRYLNITHRYVYADVQKIHEVVLNIVSNAIKYTPDGGSIKLSLTEKPCEKVGYGTYVFEVSDTGIGMSEEFQEEIFDIFTREKNTTDSKVMGTGLGMAIVKKLTELMGGTVDVKSTLGEGSTFTVTLDLRLAENPEQYLSKETQKDDETEIRLDGKRILLAEDNELNAEIATAMLENMGAEVDVAQDGVKCFNMLQEHEAGYYALILMDIQMPILNGYDATKKIRRMTDSAKANIPIVATTANAFDEDKRAALDAGMNAHIAKPINLEEMKQVFSNLITN